MENNPKTNDDLVTLNQSQNRNHTDESHSNLNSNQSSSINNNTDPSSSSSSTGTTDPQKDQHSRQNNQNDVVSNQPSDQTKDDTLFIDKQMDTDSSNSPHINQNDNQPLTNPQDFPSQNSTQFPHSEAHSDNSSSKPSLSEHQQSTSGQILIEETQQETNINNNKPSIVDPTQIGLSFQDDNNEQNRNNAMEVELNNQQTGEPNILSFNSSDKKHKQNTFNESLKQMDITSPILLYFIQFISNITSFIYKFFIILVNTSNNQDLQSNYIVSPTSPFTDLENNQSKPNPENIAPPTLSPLTSNESISIQLNSTQTELPPSTPEPDSPGPTFDELTHPLCQFRAGQYDDFFLLRRYYFVRSLIRSNYFLILKQKKERLVFIRES